MLPIYSKKIIYVEFDEVYLALPHLNFGQDYLINENLHGKVSGTITSKFLVYPELTQVIDKPEAKMDLTVYQGSIVNFAPLSAMSTYFSDRNLSNVKFDTLSNTFD